MARLQWQDVRAPDLDVRGLAVAGATIGNAFDRMSQTLQDRYNSQRAEATSTEIAKQLAITDPEAFNQAIDPTQLNSKADLAQVVQARNARALELTQTQAAREDLLNKQAATALGPELFSILKDARAGNVEAAQALQVRGLEDPLVRRALGLYAGDIFGAFAEGEEFRETQAQNDINNEQENQRIGIAREGLQVQREGNSLQRQNNEFQLKQRQDLDAGAAYGQRLLSQYGNLTPEAAAAALLEDTQFNQSSPTFQQAAQEVFTSRQPVLSAQNEARLVAENRPVGGPQTAGIRQMVDLSRDLQSKVDADSVIEELVTNGGYGSRADAKAGMQALLTDVKGATMADIMAVAQTEGIAANPFTAIPGHIGTLARVLDPSNKRMKEALQEIVDQRGLDQVSQQLVRNLQQEEADKAQGKTPSAKLLEEIRRQREILGK